MSRWLLRIISFPAFSRPMAWLADSRLPGFLLRGLIRAYVRAYRVDLSEAAEPLEAHRTFNAFFTRRLRPGARPIPDEPRLVVSPSDSRAQTFGRIPPDGRLEQIKGSTYSVAALLGSAEDAALFEGGMHATLYLSPAMYHRVHSPVGGRVRFWRHIPGRLYPVNALAVRHVPGLFAVNERVVVLIESDDVGLVAIVLVGAANVGRISLSFADFVSHSGQAPGKIVPSQPVRIERGAELGAFNLGSTVVVLAQDGKLQPANLQPGQLVRVGQPLWRLPAS